MSISTRLDQRALGKLASGEVKVAELVDALVREGAKKDDAAKAIIALQNRKEVSITESRPYSGLVSYATSPLCVWFWGAVAAVLISMALVSVTSGVVLYARYVFGSALVLFLPGYSLIEALYPKRELDELTRFALSIGLSLALVPLTGLVLNYTPFGIRLLPVTISLAGLTLVLLFVALKRKHDYYRLARDV